MIQFIISIFSSYGALTIENKKGYEIIYKKLTKALRSTDFSLRLGIVRVRERIDLKENHEKLNSLDKCCMVCYLEDLDKKFLGVYFLHIITKKNTAIDLRNNKIKLFLKNIDQVQLVEYNCHILAIIVPSGDNFNIKLFYLERGEEIYYVSAVLSECKEIRKACPEKMEPECTIL